MVSQYQDTCALAGYALTVASTGATMVQAAHIASFADTRSSDPRDGPALTPDAHWSFDEGLWTVEDDLQIVVATRAFEEWAPSDIGLKRYHGRPLYFAPRARLRPAPFYLRWHREHRFVG